MERCFLTSAFSTLRVRVSGVGKARVMYCSRGTEVVPSGPVTEREVGVVLKETDGWKLIGAFPMLDVCARVTGEEENERTATPSLRAEACGIISNANERDAREWPQYGLGLSITGSVVPRSQERTVR